MSPYAQSALAPLLFAAAACEGSGYEATDVPADQAQDAIVRGDNEALPISGTVKDVYHSGKSVAMTKAVGTFFLLSPEWAVTATHVVELNEFPFDEHIIREAFVLELPHIPGAYAQIQNVYPHPREDVTLFRVSIRGASGPVRWFFDTHRIRIMALPSSVTSFFADGLTAGEGTPVNPIQGGPYRGSFTLRNLNSRVLSANEFFVDYGDSGGPWYSVTGNDISFAGIFVRSHEPWRPVQGNALIRFIARKCPPIPPEAIRADVVIKWARDDLGLAGLPSIE